jgi:predicted dithiol-disulfide oxidoreductase (DUF899 family)
MKWPNESDEYRRARDDLLKLEIDLRRSEEAVAMQRRALPPGGEPPQDYVFDSADGPMWPLWPMLDRTPDGRGTDFEPLLEY